MQARGAGRAGKPAAGTRPTAGKRGISTEKRRAHRLGRIKPKKTMGLGTMLVLLLLLGGGGFAAWYFFLRETDETRGRAEAAKALRRKQPTYYYTGEAPETSYHKEFFVYYADGKDLSPAHIAAYNAKIEEAAGKSGERGLAGSVKGLLRDKGDVREMLFEASIAGKLVLVPVPAPGAVFYRGYQPKPGDYTVVWKLEDEEAVPVLVVENIKATVSSDKQRPTLTIGVPEINSTGVLFDKKLPLLYLYVEAEPGKDIRIYDLRSQRMKGDMPPMQVFSRGDVVIGEPELPPPDMDPATPPPAPSDGGDSSAIPDAPDDSSYGSGFDMPEDRAPIDFE